MSRRRLVIVLLVGAALNAFGSLAPSAGPYWGPRQLLAHMANHEALLEASKDKVVLAKRLNYLVFTYCSADPPYAPVEELFQRCQAQCGGISYVLWSLLREAGIEARRVSLRNIPAQGNHSLVEAKVDGEWMLLDPTFGVFFSVDGTPAGQPFGLEALYYRSNAVKLPGQVVTARRGKPEDFLKPLEALYDAKTFRGKYMQLGNYLAAESYGPDEAERPVHLALPLDLRSGKASFGSFKTTVPEAEKEFLALTNATLSSPDKRKHVSYLFSYMGDRADGDYQNLIRLRKLQRGQEYQLTLSGISTRSGLLYASMPLGGGVLKNADTVSLGDGPYRVTYQFRATEPEATVWLSLMHGNLVRLFGVRVERVTATGFP